MGRVLLQRLSCREEMGGYEYVGCERLSTGTGKKDCYSTYWICFTGSLLVYMLIPSFKHLPESQLGA